MADAPLITEDVTPIPGAVVPIQTDTSGVSSTSGAAQEQMTPADRAAMTAADTANVGVADAQQDIGPAKAAAAEDVANDAGNQSDAFDRAAVMQAADDQQYLDRIHAAQGLQSEDAQAIKDYKFHDYFHDANGDRKVGRSILSGLGALFGGVSSAPGASKAIAEQQDKNVTQDFDRQRQEYSKLIEQRKMSGEDVNALYGEWERKNAASLHKEALAREAMAAKTIEIATRSGIPVSVAENSKLVQDQRAKAAQLKLESLQRYDKHLQSSKTATSNTSTVTGKVTGNPEAQIARDPDTGKAFGMAPGGPKAAPKFNADNRNLKVAADKMEAWIKFRTDHPGRLLPGTQDAKDAEALYNDMLGANVSTTLMPGNEHAMDIEQGQIGQSGVADSFASAIKGDNLNAVKNRLAEIKKQRQLLLNQVDPLPPGYVDRKQGVFTPGDKPTAGVNDNGPYELSAGAKTAQPEGPQPIRVKAPDGRFGMLNPDGSFVPEGK